MPTKRTETKTAAWSCGTPWH